jgi:hypothetical protein
MAIQFAFVRIQKIGNIQAKHPKLNKLHLGKVMIAELERI